MAGKKIDIPSVRREVLELFLVGDSDLIVHRFSKKTMDIILDNQRKSVKGRREDRDPAAEFQEARHLRPDGTDGFPASGLRKAAKEAVTWCTGISKKIVSGSLFVTDADGSNLMRIYTEEEPVCVCDPTRIGKFPNKVAGLAYRPYFKNWHMKIRVLFDPSALSEQQVINLINRAGMSIGLGDWRPEKGGVNGMFHVADEAETRSLESRRSSKKGRKKVA